MSGKRSRCSSQASAPEVRQRPSARTRAWLLGGCVVVAASVWGIALPQLSRSFHTKDQIDRLEELGIDPSATFYSDHARAFSR